MTSEPELAPGVTPAKEPKGTRHKVEPTKYIVSDGANSPQQWESAIATFLSDKRALECLIASIHATIEWADSHEGPIKDAIATAYDKELRTVTSAENKRLLEANRAAFLTDYKAIGAINMAFGLFVHEPPDVVAQTIPSH
jgi:hypothetical protein